MPPQALLRSRARARVGSVLNGTYRLDGVLGVGGMSTVYAATHLRNGLGLAIKLLHPEIADHPELRAHFLREGRITNDVGHPGTVRVFDDDVSEDGLPYLVMDRLEGETLAHCLARTRGPIPVEEVVRVVTALLDVLAAAHRRGTLHRDIKPGNVFVTTDGSVKLLDFGIACASPEYEPVSSTAVKQSGKTGLFGTPAFMAPERARRDGAPVDVRSDIWSVGALAFALLSGHHVHESQTPQEAVLRAATEPAPPLSNAAPRVPRAVASVIDRALAFHAADRWSEPSAMRAALASEAPGGNTEAVKFGAPHLS